VKGEFMMLTIKQFVAFLLGGWLLKYKGYDFSQAFKATVEIKELCGGIFDVLVRIKNISGETVHHYLEIDVTKSEPIIIELV
jgi:hypothetical protein